MNEDSRPDEVSEVFCWSCHQDEPLPPTGGVYCVCYECGHIYLTEQDLVDAYNKVVSEMNADGAQRYGARHQPRALASSGDNILFCQLCMHDF